MNLLKQQKTENTEGEIERQMEKSPKTDSGQDEDKKDDKENTKEEEEIQNDQNQEVASAEKCEYCDANKMKIGNLNKLVGQNVATDSMNIKYRIFEFQIFVSMILYYLFYQYLPRKYDNLFKI